MVSPPDVAPPISAVALAQVFTSVTTVTLKPFGNLTAAVLKQRKDITLPW